MQKTLNSAPHQIFLALLKQSRTDQAVTQEILCERIGMVQSDISKVERGVRRLDVLELRLWLRARKAPAYRQRIGERIRALGLDAQIYQP